MSEYDNTNSGALFKNHRREKDTHPNLAGSINIEGKEYWLNGWTKEVQKGKRQGEKMISLSVRPKDQARPQQSSGTQGATPGDDLDDGSDIPF